jgi:hypothetical protein
MVLHQEQDVPFRRHMVVKGRRRHVQFLGQARHGETVVALAVDEFQRRRRDSGLVQ